MKKDYTKLLSERNKNLDHRINNSKHRVDMRSIKFFKLFYLF